MPWVGRLAGAAARRVRRHTVQVLAVIGAGTVAAGGAVFLVSRKMTRAMKAQQSKHLLPASATAALVVTHEFGGVFEGRPPPFGHFAAMSQKVHQLDVLRALERVAADPRVKGLVVKLDPRNMQEMRIGLGQMEEQKEMIAALSRTKITAASIGNCSQEQYDFVRTCSSVYMTRTGSLFLCGMQNWHFFVRRLLDWAGVVPHVFRSSKFKDAASALTDTELSDVTRRESERLLRAIHEETVPTWPDGKRVVGGPYTAAQAAALGLVDGVKYRDEVVKEVVEQVKQRDGLEQVRVVSLRAFMRRREGRPRPPTHTPQPLVGVIPVVGMILPGDATAKQVINGLRFARRAANIKAVVLRINSPGGDLSVCDEIHHEIVRLREAGKPVVASVASVAASGGYYIAAPCDAVLAPRRALVGSIGVFVVLPQVTGLLGNLGISYGKVGVDDGFSEVAAAVEGPDERARDVLQQILVGRGMEIFEQVVRDGRKFDDSQIRQFATAQVWLARDVCADGDRRSLIDTHGSYLDAIRRARELAGLAEDAQTVFLPPPNLLKALRELYSSLLPVRRFTARLATVLKSAFGPPSIVALAPETVALLDAAALF